jgi:hypothetical protein
LQLQIFTYWQKGGRRRGVSEGAGRLLVVIVVLEGSCTGRYSAVLPAQEVGARYTDAEPLGARQVLRTQGCTLGRWCAAGRKVVIRESAGWAVCRWWDADRHAGRWWIDAELLRRGLGEADDGQVACCCYARNGHVISRWWAGDKQVTSR